MTSNTLKAFVLSCVFATANSVAIAGASSGGGADLISPTHGAAWFLGQAPVHYCVEVASDFGPKQTMVAASIQHALTQWKDFASRRGITSLTPSLDFNWFYNDKCTGKEDITFLAGVSTRETEDARARFDNPVSFALEQSYDIKTGRGKGLIWLAHPNQFTMRPLFGGKGLYLDWNAPYSLDGAILHEIGHVLGNEHVEGTIMSDLIAAWVLTNPYVSAEKDPELFEERKRDLTQIESRALLVSPDYSPSMGFEGTLTNSDNFASHDLSKEEAFEKVAGRKPQGQVHAMVTRQKDEDHYFYWVEYSDDKGRIGFKVEFILDNGDFVSRESEGGVFKSVQIDPVTNDGCYRSISNSSSVRTGTTILPNGQSAVVLIATNMHRAKFEMRAIVGGQSIPLFSAQSVLDMKFPD